MSEIKCTVEECKYNRERLCDAGKIEVVSCGAGCVKSSDQTECRTFKEKGGFMS